MRVQWKHPLHQGLDLEVLIKLLSLQHPCNFSHFSCSWVAFIFISWHLFCQLEVVAQIDLDSCHFELKFKILGAGALIWSVMLQVEEEQMLEMWVKEETSATRTSVLEKWTRLQGMPQHQAMLKYMSIIKEWPGYGSTLFDVEVWDQEIAKIFFFFFHVCV